MLYVFTSLRAQLFFLALFINTALLTSRAMSQEQRTGSWQIDGQERTAIIVAPEDTRRTIENASKSTAPLVFVFHGHGGNSKQALRSFPIHQLWPESICVYPQGLNTPGKLTDPEGKRTGWQHGPEDQSDRDLKFFDVMLQSLCKDYQIDEKQVFSTGHSNGGGFTYLLWAERGEKLRAVAPSAAVARFLQPGKSKPKPVLHLAGENDELVKYAWQKLMLEQVKRLNECPTDGVPWDQNCTLFRSKQQAPLVAFVHSGTHKFPEQGPRLIVKFFKQVVAPQSVLWEDEK